MTDEDQGGKSYKQVIQDFFKIPDVAQSSVRQSAVAAGLVPGLETDAQKKEKIEIKRKQELRKRKIQSLMATDDGREWLYDILNSCNTFGTPYNPDTHSTAYNCGALYIGRSLELDILQFSTNEYSLMRKEAIERAVIADQVANENDAKSE